MCNEKLICILTRVDCSYLNKFSEGIHAEGVHEVLHAGVRAHFSVAVISLGSKDGFAELHDVVFGDESEVVCHAGEGGVFVVSAAHAASDHYVESKEFSSIVSDNY